MARILLVLLLAAQLAPAAEIPTRMLRIDGLVETSRGLGREDMPFSTEIQFTNEPREVTRYEQDQSRRIDVLFDTDIRLVLGEIDQQWSTQFGAMTMSHSPLESDVLFDVGTDVQLYLYKRFPIGWPTDVSLDEGIRFVTDGNLKETRLDFSIDSTGSFLGRVTRVTWIPEPTSFVTFMIGTLCLLQRRRY